MEKDNENFLNEKINKRNQAIEDIIQKNDLEEVVSHAEMGDPGAIFARFAYVEPEKGGYSDISQNDDMWKIAKLKVDEAVEDGKPTNTWEFYESIGNEIRKDFGDDEDYRLYREPPVSVEDQLQNNRSEAIKDMAKSRGQEG